ncbi:GUX4 [Symbiodinium sp. KB8]|nr:GUX4 [Symbiodinium sp. KB8]
MGLRNDSTAAGSAGAIRGLPSDGTPAKRVKAPVQASVKPHSTPASVEVAKPSSSATQSPQPTVSGSPSPSTAAPSSTPSPAVAVWEPGEVPEAGSFEWTQAQAAAWLVEKGVPARSLVKVDRSASKSVPPAPSMAPLTNISHIPFRLPDSARREPPMPASRAEDEAYLNRTMPEGRPDPSSPDYADKCSAFHARHAIVTMATGDNAARMALGLLQSLRDVGTCPGIDIVVMMFGGGVGSATAERAASREASVFLRAMHRLGVKLHLMPPLAHHGNGLKSVNIPGGSQLWWGMALNKLSVFNMTHYDKILWLDSDVFVMRNLDHLLFYPELTAAFTQECCNANSAPKISGGFWVIQPSSARMAQMEAAISRESPLVKLKYEEKSWQYGDMSVVLSVFANPPQAPPWPGMPKAICPRQSQGAIKHLYDEAGDGRPWLPYSSGVALGGPEDITTLPLDPAAMVDGYWHAAAGDANLQDSLAEEVGAPPGRVWHMLNATYDYLPTECACVSGKGRGSRPAQHDWYYSVHLTCLPPGVEKPGSMWRFSDWVDLPGVPECLQPWYRRWLVAFATAMGADFPASVYHSRS